jgi:hypothetical protein
LAQQYENNISSAKVAFSSNFTRRPVDDCSENKQKKNIFGDMNQPIEEKW